jgi:hypothetical protein
MGHLSGERLNPTVPICISVMFDVKGMNAHAAHLQSTA